MQRWNQGANYMTEHNQGGKKVQAYLFFDGRCEEAISFYEKAIGAQLIFLMRFKESPEPSMNPPGSGEKVMHATFRVGETEIMASDGRCTGKAVFEGFALSLTAPSVTEAQRLFAALGDGGQIQMPMTKTFFSPGFGMVADRFGVSWMVLAAAP